MTAGPLPAIAPAPAFPFARRYQREISVFCAYLGLLLLLAIAAPGFFRTQFRSTWINSAPVLVAAVGMTVVIIAREIDISIGSMFSVCGVVAGLLANHGVPMVLAVVVTIAFGGVLGAMNGGLVAFLKLPSIVVTLATMFIFRETLRLARQGEFVRDLPDNFQWLGFSQAGGEWFILITAAVVFVIFAWGMRNTAAGRAFYATGSDPEAARLAGMRPKRVVFAAFVLMGALTALAAVLDAIRFAQVDPNAGTGLELQVIAAVVVGGTAISGGRGTPVGTLVGVALLGTIGAALIFLHTQPQWQKAIQGLIILLAVAADGLTRRRGES